MDEKEGQKKLSMNENATSLSTILYPTLKWNKRICIKNSLVPDFKM